MCVKVNTLREEGRFGVFGNRVLRAIFGAEGDEVTGEWRRPHNEEVHDLCSSPNIIRVMKWNEMDGPCSAYGEEDTCMQILSWNT
jgi:hypothetical protein